MHLDVSTGSGDALFMLNAMHLWRQERCEYAHGVFRRGIASPEAVLIRFTWIGESDCFGAAVVRKFLLRKVFQHAGKTLCEALKLLAPTKKTGIVSHMLYGQGLL